MAHLFSDNTTKAAYGFEDGMIPFDYGNSTAFQNKVDLSVAGMVQDCGECHTGGGPMEYVPAPTTADRISLRDIDDTVVNGDAAILITDFTAWNYFIDVYNVDGDNVTAELGDAYADVLYMDWDNTGVMEMDCLLCHLEGYDYDARIAMLRDCKFDASRAVASGVAAPNDVAWPEDGLAPSGYGTHVYYNELVEDAGGNATFNSAILMGIKALPPSENCAFCHANMPGVDWKKRGDNWKKDVDAHWVVQCMGCHQGKVGSDIGTSGNATAGPDYKALGQCDPGKGVAPYSSEWNPKDGTVKTCADCHLRAGYDSGLGTYSPDYGAPDPTGKHMAYGLLGEICQDGVDGVADASHLDIIDCAACHVRKISDEVWNTGGAVVDASGADHEGRLTDHANDYVLREMEENLCYTWQSGKIIPSSALTTLFWRNKLGTVDVNNDGVLAAGMMDPALMTDINRINIDNEWTNLSQDNSGVVTQALIQERIDAIDLDLGSGVKMCAMTVPFKVTHNVSPASFALGHSCKDCHNATAETNYGIFNGLYALQGDDMTLTYAAGTVTTPLTKVNGSASPNTDVHFNLKTKLGDRSIPRLVFHGASNMPPINRSDFLYEDNLTESSGNITSVDGSVVATNSTQWVNYLNSITEVAYLPQSYPDAEIGVSGNATGSYPHGYGVGCNVTCSDCIDQGVGADDNSTDGCNCTMIWDMYDVPLYGSLDFTATPDSAGYTYIWNFNDGTGQVTSDDNEISHTFNSLGVKKVVLTVISPYGIADPQMINVNVVRQ